jgi:heme exporter protein A
MLPLLAVETAGEHPAVEVRGLRVAFGEQTVLRGVSLSIASGVRTGLIGPNGAGKSTLLRALAGLVRPERGEIAVHGVAISTEPWQARRAVGVVGHQPMLYPELTAAENLEFYARLYGLDAVPARVAAGLSRVGLADRADSQVATLSRGMQQRLALARALLHEPSILLLDEAESGLDAAATDMLLGLLRDDVGQRTVILASHDLGFVQAAVSEAVILRSGRLADRLPLNGQTAAWLQEQYARVLARSVERPGASHQALIGARRP